jgi:hypothetical protein
MIARMKNYLVYGRGIDESRIKSIEAGRYEDYKDALIELWLVPQGEELPTTKTYKDNLKQFSGKFYETGTWDSFDIADGSGPSLGSVRFAAFADALNEQPNSKAYIVAYNGKESVLGAWQRVGNEAKEELQNTYSISGNRIEVLFGGYEKEDSKIEYWILPHDAPPPVKKKKEKRQKETVKLWFYGEYLFEYEDRVKLMFKSFADILKDDATLNACIIVRLVQSEEPSGQILVDVEKKSINLVEIVEKWQNDLHGKYGIKQERLKVFVVTAGSDYGASVEAWIVPKGAMLPDPYAVDEDEESDEEIP